MTPLGDIDSASVLLKLKSIFLMETRLFLAVFGTDNGAPDRDRPLGSGRGLGE